MRPGRPVVLQSFSSENRDPFTTLLFDALSRHLTVRRFTWRDALLGRYDVLHMHWPDHLTKRHGALSTVVRRVLYLLLLLRVRVGRPVLVRTVHNTSPHEARYGVERALLRLTDRWTARYITMLPDTPLPSAAPGGLIPQGHYREKYADMAVPDAVEGSMLFFGLLRGYKGIPALLDAFRDTADEQLRLRFVGRALEPGLADEVERACVQDPRISAKLGWVSHEQLVTEIGRAELAVLPYLKMHNSGTVLVALSLDRPVLIPRSARTLAFAEEIGPGWVHTYEPPISADALTSALHDFPRLRRPIVPTCPAGTGNRSQKRTCPPTRAQFAAGQGETHDRIRLQDPGDRGKRLHRLPSGAVPAGKGLHQPGLRGALLERSPRVPRRGVPEGHHRGDRRRPAVEADLRRRGRGHRGRIPPRRRHGRVPRGMHPQLGGHDAQPARRSGRARRRCGGSSTSARSRCTPTRTNRAAENSWTKRPRSNSTWLARRRPTAYGKVKQDEICRRVRQDTACRT